VTVLSSLDELQAFAATTRCPECQRVALEMIAYASEHDAGDAEIEFDTACEHGYSQIF